ncbi:MAG: type II toxin-antitoxin system PemK/MazF family toxin [Sporichthyaceae bacterium]
MRRGEVFRFVPLRSTGREQQGARYGVIVQSDALLPRSVVLVAPTSTSVRPASFRPEIALLGTTTRVLPEQLAAVDVDRLGELVGMLTMDELWGVDESLRTLLDLR